MRWVCLPFFFVLSACGVIWPYAYDARDIEEQLSVAMSKDQVVKILGKPTRAMLHNDETIVWEYWRYPKGEWVGYLIHCPFHPYCYIPGEPRNPYYVAMRNDHVCLWGTPNLVRTLIERACTVASEAARADDHGWRSTVSVIPVFMPSPIAAPLKRLAIMGAGRQPDPRVASWLDLTLNSLRSHHPEMMFVEREDLHTVSDEVAIQYSGHVDDATMVRVGKLAGADSLLTYRVAVSSPGEPISASLELRVMIVETGTTLFRQTTTAIVSPSAMRPIGSEDTHQTVRRLVLEEAAAYGFAALTAAFGDNPLGIVADRAASQNGIALLGLLEGSPAARAGLKEGDRIVQADQRRVDNWTEPIPVPTRLSVDRGGERVEILVGG